MSNLLGMSIMAERDESRPAADERPIIVEERLDVQAEEPTFLGMTNESQLEGACAVVMAALRALYARRYRNPAPQDDKALFLELDGEVLLPHATLIGKLVRAVHDKEECTPAEEQMILDALADFLAEVQKLS